MLELGYQHENQVDLGAEEHEIGLDE